MYLLLRLLDTMFTAELLNELSSQKNSPGKLNTLDGARGLIVGATEGLRIGEWLGLNEGCTEGLSVGELVGALLGL